MFLRLLLLTLLVTAGWLPSISYSQPIRISYSGVSGQNLPFWVTYEAGLYKKHGLNAEMVLISGGLTNIQALLANEIAFTYLGAASPIQATLQGADVVILATAYGLMPYGLVAGKNIHSAEELKGKRVAVSRIGGIEETAARLALDKLGIGGRNVTFLQTGPDPVRIAAVEAGAAQATMLAPPGLFTGIARGLNMLADLGSLQIKYPTSVIAARRIYLTRERAVAKRYLMALVEGLQLYRQNKNFAVQVLRKYTKQASPEILSQTYDYFAKSTPAVPLTDAETIQIALSSEKPSNRRAEEFYDNSILEELAREGFTKAITNK
jgi:NitT/TauT family transport system substrate-binding protein